MRIAISIPRIDPQHGGAESWTLQFCRWLLARGHDVRIIGLKAGTDLPLPQNCVQLIAAANRTDAIKQLDAIYERECFDIIHDMGLGQHCDIFHSHVGSRYAMRAASQLARSPLTRFISNIAERFSTRKRFLSQISSAQFSNPSAWYVAVSAMVAEGLHTYEGIARNQIRCIPNGVDTDLFQPVTDDARRTKARSDFSILPNEICLLTIAHNHRLKGVPYLVKGVRELQELESRLHVLIVGGHHQREKRVSLGKHTVTYTGSLPDPTPAYLAADICVHPTFYDACSLTVLEAMSCGLPTITTRFNGAADRITHGVSGYIMSAPSQLQQLAFYLKELVVLENRRRVGWAARQEALTWTIEDNFHAMEALHQARFELNSRSRPHAARNIVTACSAGVRRTA